ncbi:type IV secretion system protein [Paracidobacterium acidisoli]|uniref:TrbL/VirB6 plasmid conjugal transfer protein n=1 Tax=Paracidobacterium acidisoli TaxID=2303751 RepID=A0A372IN17_9BACT|nr:type IV secretion system protein [Paracidobacterium acidisoli]MBT9332014.1 type IV secretion system protein [Paracidobacterium acidisoli]
MGQNIIAQLGQAITQLLSSQGNMLQSTGLDIFRGLATILIVWFGVKAALSSVQGHGGFHFAKFADLLLMISLGLGMLTYYSTPIPGTSYSFSDLVTKEGLSISNQIESDQTQQIATTITTAENQLGAPPGSFNILEDLTYLLIVVILATMEAAAFSVIAYGYVASAVCVLIGPVFIPWFIVPKMDWLFWGWLKAFIGFTFYQVVASAFVYVFAHVLSGMFQTIGSITIDNALTILPALLITLSVCIYGVFKIPDLTSSILGGRTGTWVNVWGD